MTRKFALGAGTAEVAADGSVTAVRRPGSDHSVLLVEDAPGVEGQLHDGAFRWGKGFAVLDARGWRFDHPSSVEWRDDGVDVVHHLGQAVLRSSRRFGERARETYELTNEGGMPLRVGSLAISTPWRDLYGSARDCLEHAVHAHIHTGGSDAWVWAVPMSGAGPGLGLRVTEGELWAYSISSRDTHTGSNVRGHVFLHVTDHARAPHAMGGQPVIELAPGQTLRLGWELAWYDDLAAFTAAREQPLDADQLAVEVGGDLPVRLADGWTSTTPLPLCTERPGVVHVEAERNGRRARLTALVHPPLRELVEARIRFLVERQRPLERSDSRRYAFVPYDNRSQLTVVGVAWSDWSDTRERVGSALLLQQARRRGWGDADVLDEALAGYLRFVTEHVVGADGVVRDDTSGRRDPRLYNFPWYARFLLEAGDVDRATAVMDAYYRLGGSHFLAFDLGALVLDLSSRLRDLGRAREATALTDHLLDQATTFLQLGTDLPGHEVNYEQSMVAPLLEVLLAAHALDPGGVPADALRRRLGWLQAFAADQPDVRLRHIPIRHWDGFWFGGDRLWGDVFPHYWSVLSAGVFLDWPAGLLPEDQTAALRRVGTDILSANLVSFDRDGSATCAFVYPSCVDGTPAHRADPLANDQDWALVYALRYAGPASGRA
ncbi:hypothetical protein [Auraticoccus monumenti]|uniref:Uncharacterized protein n=1 Tax=Auraticoccus monumenti TaxID=675864 RepID=A0A1G7C8G2_9ACTN|nr:hypothetical protein [Auraticoccus monumenti]SDE35664.1 hypothetical protein SAMN04489747_3198 [Auraticoccus monumenti]